MARWVKERMATEIRSLASGSSECRAVFCAPPPEMLLDVFNDLAGDGRLLTASTEDGRTVSYPVMLQVEVVPSGAREASAAQSGFRTFHGMASIRNDTRCGIYLALAPPDGQVSATHESTRKAFGVSSVASGSGSSISTWWNDPFIQGLVRDGIGAGDQALIEQARRLVHEAILAADAADQHAAHKRSAWRVLHRLWDLRDKGLELDVRISLATGFPPSADGRLDADSKSTVIASLVERLESANLGAGIEQLKGRTQSADESLALDEFREHIRSKCELITALKRSMPTFYAPEQLLPAPTWWTALTVQRWEALLEEDSTNAAVEISCTNPLAFQLKGFVPVVKDSVTLQVRVKLPDDSGSVQVRVVRTASGDAANRREWLLSGSGVLELKDDSIPPHKTPVKYVAEVLGYSGLAGSVRIISISGWEPGLIVCSRTATKGKVPKIAHGRSMEASLEMSGSGRHYLDVYLRPGVQVVSEYAQGLEDGEDVEAARIGQVSDDEYGLEVEVAGERTYEFDVQRPGIAKADKVRILLTADEVAAEECQSYFEFHLSRNSIRDGAPLPRAVHVDSQSRSAQLQGWMLDENVIARSYYPFVLAPDYAADWRRRDWSSQDETIFSLATFINDPRPAMTEMQAPKEFVNARKAIGVRIRGKEKHDLVESVNLGELLATDKAFETEVNNYIRSYLDWLNKSPTEACWCDVGLVMGLEQDGSTLEQDPVAVLVSPLHPIRFAWHCLAQRAMYLASRKVPCPAASILDPDSVPDSIVLPLHDATGGKKEITCFSVECSSDYWGILWNSARLDRLASLGGQAPLDREMGLLVGGISSGFSVAQVHRAMDDVCEMLVAKPVIGVLVSSAAGHNSACNEGIISWGRERFGEDGAAGRRTLTIGASEVHVFDERPESVRPNEAEISNLGEDTANAVQWYSAVDSETPHDLAIIAQLETSNATARPTRLSSPLGFGGLVRTRIREQQKAGGGQFLCESRVAKPAQISGDGVADATSQAISKLEGIGQESMGYVFAPSINAVKKSLRRAEFVAVSSSMVDPACFLGDWLEGTYLWDYELPSYSSRAGDSNGYYLLSEIDDLDIETMNSVLRKLPGTEGLSKDALGEILQEVARRGIPTVRGLSAGNSGATGDLGLFVATRLLQDSFRASSKDGGLLPPWSEGGGLHHIALVIPVDPFRRHLDDIAKAIKKPSMQRPDLLMVGLVISDSSVRCKLTPIEVKNRSGNAQMAPYSRLEALGQATSLSNLLLETRRMFTEGQELILWRLAYQNLLSSMIGYGFRVYSQHLAESGRASDWSGLQSRVMEALLASEASIEIDRSGRLIVIDGSPDSAPRDTDSDGFKETIELSQIDASKIVCGTGADLYAKIKEALGDWQLMPTSGETARVPVAPGKNPMGPSKPELVKVISTPAKEDLVPRKPTPGVADGSQAKYLVTDAPAPRAEGESPADLGAEQTGLDLRIGGTLDSFQPAVRRLNLGNTALNQMNMGVVGDLGTGKTQLLKSLIFQISDGIVGNREISPNVLIFDYKKDYSADDFASATKAKIVKPQRLPLNLFDVSASSQAVNPWLERYRFFADILDKIYGGIGPVQRDRLKNAIKDAYNARADGSYPTIYDVHGNYVAALKGGADSLSSILGDLVDMELFAKDPSSILTAEDFLKGVVVIALNDLGQDDRTKNMLVAIMLNVFYERMLKIPKRTFRGKNNDMRVVDSMLLVDEADNIMAYEFDVLRRILLQGREFGVGVILASQYLSHFKTGGTDYREMLLSWFVHKVPNVTAKDLAPLGLSDSSALQQVAERIKTLNLHECLYKSHDVAGEFIKGAPFYRRNEWSAE